MGVTMYAQDASTSCTSHSPCHNEWLASTMELLAPPPPHRWPSRTCSPPWHRGSSCCSRWCRIYEIAAHGKAAVAGDPNSPAIATRISRQSLLLRSSHRWTSYQSWSPYPSKEVTDLPEKGPLIDRLSHSAVFYIALRKPQAWGAMTWKKAKVREAPPIFVWIIIWVHLERSTNEVIWWLAEQCLNDYDHKLYKINHQHVDLQGGS